MVGNLIELFVLFLFMILIGRELVWSYYRDNWAQLQLEYVLNNSYEDLIFL